ncbi:MAG: GNAT family N-acetyltransferase [Alphaproteobacteria bacterium]|nr:GNAT family N-acetyltransferase [Alphaproteobacteria bacterium]
MQREPATPFHVRPAASADLDAVAALRAALWPEASVAAHRAEAAATIAGTPASTLPLVILVAEASGRIAGFAEVGLRSHADGCDPRRPVGYLEGWFVEPDQRRRGIGRALVAAAEDWARGQGCREMASDTWADNAPSQRAHAALGFAEVDRCVTYRKALW